MEQLREYNKKLLYNILPDHVAQHFLAQQAKKNDVSWCNGNLSVTAPETLFFFSLACCCLFCFYCVVLTGTLLPVV